LTSTCNFSISTDSIEEMVVKVPYLRTCISLLWCLVLLSYGCAEWKIHPQNDVKSTTSAKCQERKGTLDISQREEDVGEPRVNQTNSHQPTEYEDKNQQFLDQALESYQESQRLWAEGNIEQALRALDQAYQLILQVKTEDGHKLLQQKEDLRFLISKRILEIYASRHTAVQGNHREIPLVMNSYVEKEIRYFQTVDKNFLLESYRRSGKYRPMILEQLEKAGLPDELSWLPLIESGFRVRALSRSRALGLWQFIPSTGYKFGLKRNRWIDERMDPEKSTLAAIAYLTELHQIFGDWTTVLAAYNCGEGAVLRVIKTQKVNYLDNFWDLYEKLPYETARFVPRFLAALHIINNPEKFGMMLGKPHKPLAFEEVTINKQVRLKDIAKGIGVSYEILTSLNPELRRQVTPNGRYTLKVPPGMGSRLLAKLKSIPRWKPPRGVYVYHRVKRGETLSHIARKYRTTVNAIARLNHIRRKDQIRVGQTLKIFSRR